MTFLEMYGEYLSVELSSSDGTGSISKLFTLTRRKARVNDGMREFARLTDCVKKNGSLTLVDETATYDLEATLTDFWWLSELEGISIAIDDGTTVRYLVEGKDLTRVDKRRLDREHPGWRSADPGTPTKFYQDIDGGQTILGFYPSPDIQDDETWTATIPYLPHIADMSADGDEPFTFSSNVAKRLRPWHMAPVHWAAAKLERARKRVDQEKEQLSFFMALVKDYHDKQRIPGGDLVSIAHDYMAGTRRGRSVFAGDPMVNW